MGGSNSTVGKTTLRRTKRQRQAGLDVLLEAIPSNSAILDAQGGIVATNGAWKAFGRANGGAVAEAGNYLAVCDSAQGEDAEQAKAFATGIRSVINGERAMFSMDYPCHSANARRWFTGYVTPMAGDGLERVLVTHSDITERKKSEEAVNRSEERYQYLFKTLKEGFCILEMVFDVHGSPVDYRFLEVNDAFEKQTGLHHVQGRLMRDLAPAHEAHWFELYGKVALTGEPAHFVNEARALNRWYDVSAFRLEGTKSRKVAILFHDITDQRMAGEALKKTHAELEQKVRERTAELQTANALLRESDENFRQMAENVNEVFWLSDAKLSQFYYISPAYEKIWGRTCLELTKNPNAWLKVMHPEDTEQVALTFLSIAELGVQVRCEYRIVCPDGSVRWISDEGSPVWDEAGRVHRIAGVAQDITDRKRVEGELFETHQRLEALMQALPVGVSFSDDATCQRITGNSAVHTQFEFSSTGNLSASASDDRVVGRLVTFIRDGQPITDAELPIQRAVAENRLIPPMELEVLLPSGRRWFMEGSGAPIHDQQGNVIGGVAVTVDITERKQAEIAARKSEERLSFALQTSNTGAWDLDLRDQTATCTLIHDRIFGYETLVPCWTYATFLGHVLPEDRLEVDRRFHEATAAQSDWSIECRIRRTDGEIRWIWTAGAYERNPEGQPVRMVGIVQDITVRKVDEDAMKRANRALLILKECDEALVRATSEPELLDTVCQILINIGDARLVWIGFAEDDVKKTVRVVAHAGQDEGYLKKLTVTWADEPRGRGPVGKAIRTHEVSICRNISTDPSFDPWRKDALKRGYAATIALPLISDNHCLGTLIFYSPHVDAFNEQEVNLLTQLAGDLTYGIVALRTRADREKLQEALLKISEREKQVIAQELHDGLCQHFAGTAMMSSLLHRRLAARQDPEAGYAKQICDLLSTGILETRNLAHGLHPVSPKADGLMGALSSLAQTVTALFHVRCTSCCADSVFINDQTAATHLFRIAQEATNNAVKHGQASKVLISLKSNGEEVTLSIRDNGIGIPCDRPVTSGMGMQIMKHRAASIGAAVSICRAGKRGTVVTCTLPCQPV